MKGKKEGRCVNSGPRDDNKNQRSYIRVFAFCQQNLLSRYAPVNGALLGGRLR
jgi:hypothetical protein